MNCSVVVFVLDECFEDDDDSRFQGEFKLRANYSG